MPSAIHTSREQRLLWERFSLASGIIYAMGQVGAFAYFAVRVFPQMGPPDATAQHLAFYTQQGHILRLGNYLLMLPLPFLLVFLGGLFGVLRRAHGSSTLAVAAVTADAAVAVLWPLSAVVNTIAIDIAEAGGDAATIIALDAIGAYALALSALPRAVLLLATAGVFFHDQRTPRLITWSGVGLALLSLGGTATLVVADLFPLLALSTLLFEVWLAALSVVLLRRARTTVRGVPQGMPA